MEPFTNNFSASASLYRMK